MSTGSIRLITTQKVLKTWNVKGMKEHYLGSNQLLRWNVQSPTQSREEEMAEHWNIGKEYQRIKGKREKLTQVEK